LKIVNIFGIIYTGGTDICQQKMKENPTACDSNVSLKDIGMKSTKNGGKGTLNVKEAAAVPGAGKS